MRDMQKKYFPILLNIIILFERIINNTVLILRRRKSAEAPLRSRRYLHHRVFSEDIESILNGNCAKTKKHLRITYSTFKKILEVMPRKHHGWTVEYELLIFLYWMASGCSYRVAGCFAGLSKSSVQAIIYKMLNFFTTEMRHIIHLPNESYLEEIGRKFCSRAKTSIFQHAIGAIDGCHIRIKCPVDRHDEYINHKRFYSIVLQAVVDSSGKFIDVFIGFPGSVHDTRVLYNSPLYRNSTFPSTGHYLLGDGGYPCKLTPCPIVTPYRNPNEQQKKFNTVHSKARNIVECSFGIMKNRWRNIFYKALEQNIPNCVKVVAAACILHNICMMGEDFNSTMMENTEDIFEDNTQNTGSEENDSNEGTIFRDSLLHELMLESLF